MKLRSREVHRVVEEFRKFDRKENFTGEFKVKAKVKIEVCIWV